MRAWKVLIALALFNLVAVGAHAAYVQYVTLADIKANGTGKSYFAGTSPVKYWNFRGQNASTTIANAGQVFPNTTPSLNGTTNRELSIGLVPYDADAGVALLGKVIHNPCPSPSPAPNGSCSIEGSECTIQGHALANTTTISCCWHGGSLIYQRGVCQ